MLKILSIALCCAGLLGCATQPAGPDLSACGTDADRAPNVESLRSRMAFIDGCMVRKGWSPTDACVELMMQGSKFCDYVKVRAD